MTYLTIPGVLFSLVPKANLPFGYILQIKLLEHWQLEYGFLVCSGWTLVVLLLDFRDDLVYDSLRHCVTFKRR
jgi:hypothetical protein